MMWGIIYVMLVVSWLFFFWFWFWFRFGVGVGVGGLCVLSFFSFFFLLVCLLYAPQTCFHALFFALCASASASALRGRRIFVFGGAFVASLSRGVSSRWGVVLMFDATGFCASWPGSGRAFRVPACSARFFWA